MGEGCSVSGTLSEFNTRLNSEQARVLVTNTLIDTNTEIILFIDICHLHQFSLYYLS